MMWTSDAQIVLLLLGWLFVLFRIYTLIRVAKDISWRTAHTGTQLFSIALITFFTPIFWLPLYFLLRPVQRKDVLQYQQEIEDLLQSQTIHCQSCGWANFHDHLFCVFCGEKIKQLCSRCAWRYSSNYLFCPYCAEKSDRKES